MLSSDHIISRLTMANLSVLVKFLPSCLLCRSCPTLSTHICSSNSTKRVGDGFFSSHPSLANVCSPPHSKADLCSLSLPLCLSVSPTTNPNSVQNCPKILLCKNKVVKRWTMMLPNRKFFAFIWFEILSQFSSSCLLVIHFISSDFPQEQQLLK